MQRGLESLAVEPRGTQVMVHLGRLPRYASHYAAIAAAAVPTMNTVLIMDSNRRPKIPGVGVVSAKDLADFEDLKRIQGSLSKLGIDPHWRNGYWSKIFMRFVLLRTFMESTREPGLAVQLESDVLSSLSPELLTSTLPHLYSGCYMPFIDNQTAGPGLMLALAPPYMAEACRFVIEALHDQITFSDMAALALAQEAHLVKPLPSRESESAIAIGLAGVSDTEEAKLVFDAAATGQYLFGIDPRNNNGIVKPGYLETRGGLDPGRWANWRIQVTRDGRERVTCEMGSGTVVFANVHVHSKVIAPAPSHRDPSWIRTLRVANGQEPAKARLRLSAIGLNSLRRMISTQ